MKKIMLCIAALAIAVPSFAQWTNGPGNINNTNTGNVGIGKNTPGALLTVGNDNGNGTTDLQRPLNVVNGASVSPVNNNGVGISFLVGNNLNPSQRLGTIDVVNEYFNINSSMRFSTITGSTVSEKMRIDGSGNIGIGTTNPAYKLDVNGVINSNNDIISTNGTVRALLSVSNSYTTGIAGTITNHDFAIYTNSLPVARFTTGGNLLIGKTSQTNTNYKLDINGSARVNSIVVNTTGADFVFNDKYILPNLSKVESYINKNHHLPEIPSAGEMKNNGMDIGELNTKLLQKVEELTLYMIELKKQNDVIQKQNRELKKEVVKIKKRTLVK